MTEKEVTKFNEKPDKVSVFFIPMMIGNMAAGTVAMHTGFKGDNFCTTTACASGTHAIGEAFRKIKDGYLDVCLWLRGLYLSFCTQRLQQYEGSLKGNRA